MFSTVRIETFNPTSKGYATGLLFTLGAEEHGFVVTNRHVFKDAETAILNFHVGSDNTENSHPTGERCSKYILVSEKLLVFDK